MQKCATAKHSTVQNHLRQGVNFNDVHGGFVALKSSYKENQKILETTLKHNLSLIVAVSKQNAFDTLKMKEMIFY